MPKEECYHYGNDYFWEWEEAFQKFGFGDGDLPVRTPKVVQTLEEAGYVVVSEQWGVHNLVISSIKEGGTELMPENDETFVVGYDDPRDYLPEKTVSLLDEKLG